MPVAAGRYVFSNGVSAFFEMPTSDARRILPEHLEPVEVTHQRSILAVTAFHFTESVAGPYVELMSPSLLALVFASSTLFRLATVGLGERFWHPIMVPLLVLAAIGVLAKWPWYLRALLHAAWIASLCSFAFMYGDK